MPTRICYCDEKILCSARPFFRVLLCPIIIAVVRRTGVLSHNNYEGDGTYIILAVHVSTYIYILEVYRSPKTIRARIAKAQCQSRSAVSHWRLQ